MCVVTARRSVWKVSEILIFSVVFLMLVNLSSFLTIPFFSFSRWVWCLYHCVFRECHACAIYRRNCGRSDWLWVPGYHSNLVLLLIRRWCIGSGELSVLSFLAHHVVMLWCDCVHVSIFTFQKTSEGVHMFYQHKKVHSDLSPLRSLLTKQFGEFET